MLTGMGTAALRAQGNIRVELYYALIGAVILVVLYYPGYLWMGYHGMIGVEVLAGVVSAAWFLYAFGRRQRVNVGGYLAGVLARPLIVMSPLIAAALVGAPHVHFAHMFAKPRVNLLVDMMVAALVFGSAAAVCAWFGMFSDDDRESLRSSLALRRSPAKGVGPA
jgi:hypothetical protein